MCYALHLDMFEATLTCSQGPNKPNWDKLQAISVLTSDSPQLGPALKKNPYILYIYYICTV